MTAPSIGNLVLETANNPGTGTINLGGAPSGRRPFSAAFSTGATAFYFLTDGTQTEWGLGTYTSGSPDTLARTTVYGNTSGTSSRLNFTGSVQVYNDVPVEQMVTTDSMPRHDYSGVIVQKLPTGIIEIFGRVSVTTDASANAVIAYPESFPTACVSAVVTLANNSANPSATVNLIGAPDPLQPGTLTIHYTGTPGTTIAVTYIAKGY